MENINLEIKPIACKYYDSDSGYGVYDFETEIECNNEKLKALEYNAFNDKAYGTIVGNMQQLDLLQKYKACMKENYNSKYECWQFKSIVVNQEIPKELSEKKKFLNFFLTEKQTETLLEIYPNIIEMIVEDDTKNIDLSLTKGIKETKFNKIKEKIYENYILMDIINYLAPYGVTYNKIKKIVDKYGSPLQAKRKIEENFYILTEVDGFAFKSADQIALKINPNLKISKKRLFAFIDYALKSIGKDEGHTWINHNHLMAKVRGMIPECSNLLKTYLKNFNNEEYKGHEEYKNKYYIDSKRIGLKLYYNQELNILNELNRINDCNNFMKNTDEKLIDEGIKKAEEIQGFTYIEKQREAVKSIFENNVVIIAGKAGSGKTSVVKGITTLIEALYPNAHVGQCALSAKAARRMYEVTARAAYTIHKILAWQKGKFRYSKEDQMPYDVIIADEFSMNNIYISNCLFQAVKDGAKLILVFDFAQLPPIGSGAVAYDLLEKSNFTKFKFNKVHRQAEKSGILKDANLIRLMENPIKKLEPSIIHGDYKDMIYKFIKDRDKIHDFAVKSFIGAVQKYGLNNVLLICPRKDTVQNSIEMFNKSIQEKLNINSHIKIRYGVYDYQITDKIIHRVNNYKKDIVNGEMGIVSDIIDKKVIVDFGNDIYELMDNHREIKKIKTYEIKELAEIQLGYGLTVHSAQGSQADIVIVVLDNTHYTLLDATMLYTAITRAKKKCLLIAEPSAFKRCINTNKTINRNTFLQMLFANEESN